MIGFITKVKNFINFVEIFKIFMKLIIYYLQKVEFDIIFIDIAIEFTIKIKIVVIIMAFIKVIKIVKVVEINQKH